MINTSTIDKLTQAITNQLPSGIGTLSDEITNNIKAILQVQFNKLDLVTREEFDTQNAVLLRTRKKLDALEKTLDKLTIQ